MDVWGKLFNRSVGTLLWHKCMGKVFDSRKECLKTALQEILDGHREAAERLKNDTCGNFNAQYSKEVTRQVKNLLDELTGRKAIQLELFQ